MFELTRKVLSGTVLAAITGGVLLWGLSPGMTLKREYESYNGKPAGSEHTLQAITVPAYANVQGVTALEACTLQDGILVLAYPTCPYCRNLMPELLDAAEATDTSLYYCTLDRGGFLALTLCLAWPLPLCHYTHPHRPRQYFSTNFHFIISTQSRLHPKVLPVI